MSGRLQFDRVGLIMLIVNAVVLGGCIVMLFLIGSNGPLILLTIGAAGLLAGKIRKAYTR